MDCYASTPRNFKMKSNPSNNQATLLILTDATAPFTVVLPVRAMRRRLRGTRALRITAGQKGPCVGW